MFGSRHFLFEDDGRLRRVSQRVWQGLGDGTDRLPEFAGRTVKAATVGIELMEGRPHRVLRIDTRLLYFDDDGSPAKAMEDAFLEGMRTLSAVGRDPLDWTEPKHRPPPTFLARRNRQLFEERYEWEPTPVEITKLVHAIWPEQAGGAPVSADWTRGTRRRKAPMTIDSERAAHEIRRALFKVQDAIDDLKDKSLKGLIDEAKQEAEDGNTFDHALWSAVAAATEHRLAVVRAREKKTGSWVAAIERTVWLEDGSGHTNFVTHEVCDGRDAAEKRVRELLREHADRAGFRVTIETVVQPAIEWDDRGMVDVDVPAG